MGTSSLKHSSFSLFSMTFPSLFKEIVGVYFHVLLYTVYLPTRMKTVIPLRVWGRKKDWIKYVMDSIRQNNKFVIRRKSCLFNFFRRLLLNYHHKAESRYRCLKTLVCYMLHIVYLSAKANK